MHAHTYTHEYTHTHKAQCLGSLLDLGSNKFLIWVCYSSPFLDRPKELLVLSEAQNRRDICSRFERHPADPEAAADRDALWGPWEVLVAEL